MVSQTTLLWVGYFILLAFGVSATITNLWGAPWVPSSRGVVRKMLEMAKVEPGDRVFDLGSGDGRIVIMAARDFGAVATGVEIDPFRAAFSRLAIRLLGLGSRARIVRSSFYNVDLSTADVVTLYLLQGTNDRLRPKLERELKPGCRVVSHSFTFEWELLESDERAEVYVYRPRPAPPQPGHAPDSAPQSAF